MYRPKMLVVPSDITSSDKEGNLQVSKHSCFPTRKATQAGPFLSPFVLLKFKHPLPPASGTAKQGTSSIGEQLYVMG